MLLKDILERRTTVETEMRSIYDAAETAGADLSGEKLEKWNTLKTELDDLASKEDRARTRDALDRKEPGKSVAAAAAGTAWGLKPEQRMADYVRARTGGPSDALSLGRAIAGVMTGNWRDAEAERRTMGTGTNLTGGFLVPDPLSAQVIDLVRNASVLINAGALTLPMTGNTLTVARVVSDPTAAWRAEGAAISESDANFGAILITPKSLAALCRVNAELLDDVPSFAAQLDAQLSAALALELDRVGLYGSGVNAQPQGLRNINTADGINEISMGTNGAIPTDYDDFLDLIRDVELDNGAPDTLIWSPRTKNTMAEIVTGVLNDKTKLAPPVDFVALKKIVSNQVSVTETQGSSGVASTAFLGGFNNMAIAMRQQIQVEASRVSSDLFTKNQVHVRAILRADIAVMRPDKFGRLVGILA